MDRRDLLLAVVSGIVLVLIFPSLNLKELSWVCLVPLLSAAHKKEPSKGFLLGCTAGSIFHLGLIYWVTVSMTTYGKLPVYLSIILLILFSIFLGLFIAIPMYLSCYVQKVLKCGFTLTLPFFWTAFEYIKSWFLTGFPWDNLGYSQFKALPVIQIADITGVYGISFLLVLANCAAFSLLQGLFIRKKIPYSEVVVTLSALALTLSYGQKRLNFFKESQGDQLKLAIIQPNIPQDLKWDPSFLDETIDTYRRLTLKCAPEHPDMVVWPESSTPFYFQSEDKYKVAVADIVKQVGAYLLLGSPSWELQLGAPRFFNSAFLISARNMIEGKYDKIHLVPYGEYVPLKKLFPFINKMVVGIGDFSPGSEIKNLQLPSCSFATLICYEIIFPDLVRKFVKKGAHFIVNITNDAWFGRTSAPYQHLSMAVLRAVENRRYIARAANTGISAFIHPGGTILKQTKLFTQEVLPAIIFCRTQKTFYTLYGDVFALFCFAVSLFFILAARIKKRALNRTKG
jgi:apolipoprotein N-acyltransferase